MIEIVSIRLEEERKDESRRKTLSGVLTFVITALLVLLLVFFGMPYMDPPPPEEGAVVALGEPDAGMNNNEPQTQQQPQTESSPEDPSSQTQDFEEAPSETPSETPTKPNPVPSKDKKKDEPKVDPNKLFTPGGGEDDGEKEGPKGDPTGTGEDPLGTGSGTTGSGVGWSLKGRKLVNAPDAKCSFPESGTLVLKITVNSSGQVISSSVDYKKSNVTDVTNINCAKNAVSKYLFNVKEGSENVSGEVVFNFKKR